MAIKIEPEQVVALRADNSIYVFWVVSVETNQLIYMSPNYDKIWGSDRAPDSPNFFLESIHPQDRERVMAGVAQQMQGEYREEYRIIRRDGSVRWVKNCSFPLRNQSGEVYQIVGRIDDITACREIEEERDRLFLQERAAVSEAQKARERLANIWESITDAFVSLDNEGHYIYVNRKAEIFLDKTRSELLGKKLWEIFPIEPDSQHYNQGCKAMRDRVPVEYEDFYPPLNKWFAVCIYPSQEGLSIYFQDITERKQTEQALRLSEQRFRVALQNTPIVVFNQDRELRYTWIYNPKLGYAVTEVLGKTDADLVHSQDAAQLSEIKRQVLETGIGRRAEVRASLKGEFSCYDLTIEPLRDESGKVVGITAAGSDVSASKRAEAALRETNLMLESLIQASPVAILAFDSQYIVKIWNPAAEKIFGWSKEEAIGRAMSIVPEDQKKAFFKKSIEVLQGKTYTNYETIRQKKDGSRLEVSISTAALRDAKGEINGVMAVIVDISDRKALEAALQHKADELARANLIKDEFLAIVSHELRTPLSAILGWAQTLLSRNLNETITAKALRTIEQSAKLQAKIIDDILDVSRIIQGKIRLKMGSVNLIAVINAAIEIVSPTAEAKAIQIETLFDSTAAQVVGDSERLQQVVWNLLSNAVKFTPHKGRVKVRLDRVDGCAQITVSDNGKGISPEFLPHVFERFCQADASTTRTHNGLGLGLAIVRHLVELHGGTVKAASESEGKGATFTVALPLHKYKDEKIEDEINPGLYCKLNPSSILSGLRVLVVDDDATMGEWIAFTLGQDGARVTVVESASEAIEAIAQFQPDILISDIGLPEEDGYSLIERSKALEAVRGRILPAIALTVYARQEDCDRALKAGFDRHLAKPIEPAQLTATVAKLAGRL